MKKAYGKIVTHLFFTESLKNFKSRNFSSNYLRPRHLNPNFLHQIFTHRVFWTYEKYFFKNKNQTTSRLLSILLFYFCVQWKATGSLKVVYSFELIMFLINFWGNNDP